MNGTTIQPSSPTLITRHRFAWITLLALIALLFSLLAMHSVATNSAMPTAVGHSHAAVSPTAMTPITSRLASSEVSAVPALMSVCAGANALDCLMLGAMCTIGMTAVGMTILLYQRSSRHIVPAALARASAFVSRHVAPLRPPSLLILSISRT